MSNSLEALQVDEMGFPKPEGSKRSSCRMCTNGVDCSRTEEKKVLSWDLPGMGVFEAAQE